VGDALFLEEGHTGTHLAWKGALQQPSAARGERGLGHRKREAAGQSRECPRNLIAAAAVRNGHGYRQIG
jgi:hypothetical protein